MSILYFDFLCFSCYCSIKNAQINGTLGIMWEMFIGEKRPMWCMQEGLLKWGTLVIMWRRFMKESLSVMAFVPLDSRSALRVSHGRFRSSLRSRSTLPASQLRLHSSPKVGLACITLHVIQYLFGLIYLTSRQNYLFFHQ